MISAQIRIGKEVSVSILDNQDKEVAGLGLLGFEMLLADWQDILNEAKEINRLREEE